MPAATRSATKQPTLEEVKGTETEGKKANETGQRKAVNSKKRKADSGESTPKQSKSQKAAPPSQQDPQENDDHITINRAPVLELWTSCVTHLLYPDVSWDTCLSVGGAIATITAISKGRSIGTMDKPDPGEAQERRRKRMEKAEKEELEEIEVMGFKLRMKDGHAEVGDKPKKGSEAALKKKFGDEQYERVKLSFEQALGGWEGKEHELDGSAFKMYEHFRPSIPPGQKGWGKKGQLNLHTVKDVVGAD